MAFSSCQDKSGISMEKRRRSGSGGKGLFRRKRESSSSGEFDQGLSSPLRNTAWRWGRRWRELERQLKNMASVIAEFV